ncbi:hypothetical protein F5X97DRAFT_344784 [Nemania serpens]|nr:hypothetical protein F5X97DRAFT_344784 [Nemania serpens]
MESQQELCTSNGEGNQAGLPSEQIFTRPAKNHKKARPSVDTDLAQEYRERQDLPTVGREHAEAGPQEEAEYVKIMLDESVRADRDRQTAQPSVSGLSDEVSDDGKPPRDRVTGRTLSQFGRSCLRCTEKGLRCTYNFFGKEDETQCAACRRSKTPYCIRFKLPRGNEGRSFFFRGTPWKNPNFIAGTAASGGAAPEIPKQELEDILREFYIGPSGYVLGDYLADGDVRNFALPPFNGADRPLGDRPVNYEMVNWKHVLPVWKNRSLRPWWMEGEMDEEHENKQKRLAAARDRYLWPMRMDEEEQEGEEAKLDGGDKAMTMMMQVVSDDEKRSDEVRLFRALRRYEPREKNMDDVVGDTW